MHAASWKEDRHIVVRFAQSIAVSLAPGSHGITLSVPQANVGGDVCCFFEIGSRFIGLVHNQVTPPRVGINVFFAMTLPLNLRVITYLATATVGI